MVTPTLEIQLTREYFLVVRDGLLRQVDAIERLLDISPRTTELRQADKQARLVLLLEKKQESEKV